MEPHLLGGGPTGGQTGPDLFPTAIAAFKKIVQDAGGQLGSPFPLKGSAGPRCQASGLQKPSLDAQGSDDPTATSAFVGPAMVNLQHVHLRIGDWKAEKHSHAGWAAPTPRADISLRSVSSRISIRTPSEKSAEISHSREAEIGPTSTVLARSFCRLARFVSRLFSRFGI